MKSKEEIEERIKKIKNNIIFDVLSGTFSNHSLEEQRNWCEALAWVLNEED